MEDKIKKIIDAMGNDANELIFLNSKLPKNKHLATYLEKADIEVRYFNDDKLDGFLKWNKEKNKPIISVNANKPEVKRNFSMAHELGHLIIDYNWIPFSENKNFHTNKEVLNVTKCKKVSNYTPEKKNERIIDTFATSFLMPTKQIEAFINDYSDMNYQDAVELVAKTFDVSKRSADIRLSHFL